MSIEKKFSNRLKQLRQEKGLTQEELASMAQIDYKHLQRLEGSSPPSPTLSTIYAISKALDVSLSEFFNSLS